MAGPTREQIIAYIVEQAQRYGVPVNIALGVAQVESGINQFRSNGSIVTSVSGALGVMQLMPKTAAGLGVDPADWRQNVEGGVRYLKQMFSYVSARGGGWAAALSAYNQGPGGWSDRGIINDYHINVLNQANTTFSGYGSGGTTDGGGTGGTGGGSGTGGGTNVTGDPEREATTRAYSDIARYYGWTLTSAMLSSLWQDQVSTDELRDRFEALRRVKEYQPAWLQFESILKARGILGQNGSLTLSNMLDYTMGRAPQQWYAIAEEFGARTALVSSGLSIGPGGDFTRDQIQGLIKRLPGQQTEEELLPVFQQLAMDIQTMMPLSKLAQVYGLTKGDLLNLRTGGPNAPKIAERVQSIINTVNASLTPESVPQLVATTEGGRVIGSNLAGTPRNL